MEYLAQCLMQPRIAMTSPAQSTARSALGAVGALARSLATGAVLGKAGGEDLSSLHLNMEEHLAQFLMAHRVATTSPAQNTVRWELGVPGVHVQNHANPVKVSVKGLSPVDPVMAEYLARFLMERGAAMTFHALSTARLVIGAIGVPAPSHATLVKANGGGTSPNKQSMEDRLAQFLKPLEAAATSHADVLMGRLVMENVALKTQTGTDFLTDSQMDHALFLVRTIVFLYQILGKRTQTVMA